MSNDRDGKEDEDANNNEDDTDCEKVTAAWMGTCNNGILAVPQH